MNYRKFSSARRGRAVLFAVYFGAAALASAQIAGVPNFRKVNDRVYRGGQPTRDGFKNLAALGVKTVVDLRETGEHSQTREQAWVTSENMHYVTIPLKQMSAPRDTRVARVLAILNDPAAEPVFVHCRRGSDRTGTIIACYRISHDRWDNRKALKEARRDGMSFFERGMQHYVMRYKAGAGLQR